MPFAKTVSRFPRADVQEQITVNRLPLSTTTIRGDQYEIGIELGRLAEQAIKQVLPRIGRYQDVMRDWLESPRLQLLEAAARQHFPQHVRTIEGIADGAQMKFADIFAWNCRGDFPGGGDQTALAGCTDVMSVCSDKVVMGHNEDDQAELDGHCWLIDFEPNDGVAYTSFYSPGLLPGHTFGWNAHGLVQTINHIRTHDQAIGVPRHLLSRAILDCPSLADAEALIRATPRAGGFHHNLGRFNETPEALSVEAPATGVSAIALIANAPRAHANHLTHPSLQSVPQTVAPSSAARQLRATEICSLGIQSQQQARALLADGSNAKLPICRKGASDQDPGYTLASATFELTRAHVRWSVFVDARTTPDFAGDTPTR